MKNRSRLTIFTTILSVLASFALLPQMKAAPQVAPAPDGCYPGFTTAEGCNALLHLGAGAGNTGVGWYSLFFAGGSNYNTGVGAGTLVLNTADSNTAVGAAALLLNTTGSDNTAVGTDALALNTSAFTNVAVGTFAAQNNDSGGGAHAVFNTAVGGFALKANVNGTRNTAVGAGAIESGDGGNDNTAVGELAGNNITGNGDSCFGSSAGIHIVGAVDAVVIGNGTNGAGTGLVSAARVISIGNVPGVSSVFGDAHDSCYIGSIYNQNIGGAGTPHAVWVDADGTLGLMPSSRRFKHDIKPMDQASAALLALKPVTFKYNSDKKGTQQFGLIAEEVAEVNPDLILRDDQGTILSVRYEQINAMLLNEFLKEHKKVEALETTVAQQAKGMEVLTAQLKEQAAQIQKVSAQLEVNKAAPQVVTNKP